MVRRHLLKALLLVSFAAAVACGNAVAATAPKKPATAQPRVAVVELKAGEAQLESQNGTFVVPVLINGVLTLKFTLDSGASDISVPSDVVSTLIRTGTISAADFIGEQTYILADGSRVKSPTFRLRTITVGGITLRNVLASVADTKGSLLLGQSFLSRIGSWSVDNVRHVLILNGGSGQPGTGNAPQAPPSRQVAVALPPEKPAAPVVASAASPDDLASFAYASRDYATAYRLWRPLADQGQASAQYGLGILYRNGHGVAQDYAAAVSWFRKAADQGDANAQYGLGARYHAGQGVMQDYAAALVWYRKAADQGNASAQTNLKALCTAQPTTTGCPSARPGLRPR